jgi:hypothetical protein
MTTENLCVLKLKTPIVLGDKASFDIVVCSVVADVSSPFRDLGFIDTGKSVLDVRIVINPANIEWCLYEESAGAIDALFATYSQYPYALDLT